MLTRIHHANLALVALVALVALASCGGDDDVATATTPDTTSVPAAPPSTSAVPTTDAVVVEEAGLLPFVDEFDDDRNGWGGPYQRFEGGAYVWDMPSGQADARAADALIAVESELDAVRIVTEFTSEGVDAVGVQCAYEEIGGSSQWYDLELGTRGLTIRKQPLGDAPVETLGSDASVTLGELPVTMEATCASTVDGYQLTLAVDDDVLEVIDPAPFGAGAPGLIVRAAPDGPDAPTHVVRFERFEVDEL